MHPKVANSMAMTVLSFIKALVGTGWAASLLICIIGLRKQFSYHVVPPLAVKFHSLDKRTLVMSADSQGLVNEGVWLAGSELVKFSLVKFGTCLNPPT